jgi:ribosomal protein S18 acetylase RimI-like enzyme
MRGSIRRAQAEDAAGILECLAEAFEPYRARYTREAFLDTVLTAETVSRRLEEMTIFVAVSESGTVMGTVACRVVDAEEGHVRGMAVRSREQGSGLGAQLLHAAEAALRSRGCSRVTLDTTEVLQAAIRFYEKHGYRRSGRVADFFGMRLIEYVKAL